MSFYMNMALNEGKMKDFLDKKSYQRKEEKRKQEMEKHRGEQAYAYKRRKRDEERNKNNEDFNRHLNRNYSFGCGYKTGQTSRNIEENPGANYSPARALDNLTDNFRAKNRADREIEKRTGSIRNKKAPVQGGFNWRDRIDIADGISRHNRRHPDRYIESGIFSECNFIEFAY